MTCRTQIRCLFVLAVFLWAAMVNLTGCRQHPENSVFTFLFPEESSVDVTETGPERQEEITEAEEKTADEEQYYVLVSHKPYMERKCVECHEGASAFTTPIFGDNWDGIFRKGGGKPGPLTLPVKKLCLKCHKDLAADWAKERGLYLHKTAAEGECIKCHFPHQGRHPFRLIDDDTDQLCYRCHNANEKTGIPKCVRELQVTGPCLSCHNAHLGTSKALLKKDYEEPKHTVFPKQGTPGENLSPADKKIPE